MDVDVDMVRKLAAQERGQRAFESYGEETPLPLVDELRLQKAGEADPELLAIALWSTQGDPLELYEVLGGEYNTKEAGALGQVAKAISPTVSKSMKAGVDVADTAYDSLRRARQADRSAGILHQLATGIGLKKSHYRRALERSA
jgi:hypothetical protein